MGQQVSPGHIGGKKPSGEEEDGNEQEMARLDTAVVG
jgi:hypothetical protein